MTDPGSDSAIRRCWLDVRFARKRTCRAIYEACPRPLSLILKVAKRGCRLMMRTSEIGTPGCRAVRNILQFCHAAAQGRTRQESSPAGFTKTTDTEIRSATCCSV